MLGIIFEFKNPLIKFKVYYYYFINFTLYIKNVLKDLFTLVILAKL